MSHGRVCVFSALAAVVAPGFLANAQSVISTRAGVIHFFEGAVYLGDQRLESHLGRFPSVPQGAELRTAEGRAEVLLTPGIFVRLGPMSAIRMVANGLSDTRVELLGGSAIVDAAEPSDGTSVTLIYKDWNVHFPEKGVYRIDSESARLWVLQGRAEVSAATRGAPIPVEQGTYLPFAAVLVPERSLDQPRDALSNWAEGRQQSIFADNAIAANIQDPGSMNTSDPGFDSLTYFPMIGLTPGGVGLSSLYSSGLYQPGFNSIYLPGYAYWPFYRGFALGGVRLPLQNLPPRIGLSPPRIGASPPRVGITPSPIPRAPVPRPTSARPVTPARVGVHR